MPAFLEAQSVMEGAHKSGKNPHLKSTYARLEDVLAAVKGPLNANGIFITHRTLQGYDSHAFPGTQGERLGFEYLQTRLIHTSGQFTSSIERLLLGPRPDMQAKGAAETYAQRYNLIKLCALSVEDDDGQSIRQPDRPARRNDQPQRTQAPRQDRRESPTERKPVPAPAPPRAETKKAPDESPEQKFVRRLKSSLKHRKIPDDSHQHYMMEIAAMIDTDLERKGYFGEPENRGAVTLGTAWENAVRGYTENPNTYNANITKILEGTIKLGTYSQGYEGYTPPPKAESDEMDPDDDIPY